MTYRIAVDIGGTFTDLVLQHEGTGVTTAAKVLSTPGHLVDGVVSAVRASGVPAADVSLFVHGTTAGLNAVLERRGASVALVTTRGFRDTYLIGRGHRPRMYDLHYVKPEPLLDRSAILEIDERMSADGEVLRLLDTGAVDDLVAAIREGAYEAVAICLLHAYANPLHESQFAEALRTRLDLPVVASNEVAPVWREYERTATTVMSAYITPIMARYLADLAKGLSAEGMAVPIYITESNGGVMGSRVAVDKAILTLFSGPVGGAVGTQRMGDALAIENLIAIDVGGTSFDVSLVRDGAVSLQSEFELQGLPVLAPSVDVHTIGAGGGSLLREVGGLLRVGPQSAGANPGPVCYGLGGTQPTVTDANLVLGRIPREQRLAGSVGLDLPAARQALDDLGRRFGLSAEQIAEEALAVVHFSMAEAIRELTVERGLDPRDFVLCAFGGAGGLHAVALAEELEIRSVLVPALPGAFSAWGMLSGDIKHDAVVTYFRSLQEATSDLHLAVERLRAEVGRLLQLDDAADLEVRFETAADLRYVGQEYSLTLPLADGEIAFDAAAAEAVAGRFHAAYHERYGHSSPEAPVEFVALRVAGIAARRESGVSDATSAVTDGQPLGIEQMHIRGEDVPTAVYTRDAVTDRLHGPVIILEETATTVVDPGWTVRPVAGGHLLLERDA